MSFINIRNNRGPKIDPGYSTITYNYANTFPFNTTLCYLALITHLSNLNVTWNSVFTGILLLRVGCTNVSQITTQLAK